MHVCLYNEQHKLHLKYGCHSYIIQQLYYKIISWFLSNKLDIVKYNSFLGFHCYYSTPTRHVV